jgi:toxin CcdB
MARFDVYPMPNNRPGYVVDVQADLIDQLATRAVVPLLPLADFKSPIRDLNPIFEINGESYVFAPQAIATVPVKVLGSPKSSLDRDYHTLTRALDILLTGV